MFKLYLGASFEGPLNLFPPFDFLLSSDLDLFVPFLLNFWHPSRNIGGLLPPFGDAFDLTYTFLGMGMDLTDSILALMQVLTW